VKTGSWLFWQKKMYRQTEKRNCNWCGKEIKGRTDKKYCDDACRSAFNNQRNSGENNVVKNINYALARNRRILSDAIPPCHSAAQTSREYLVQQGFQFKYLTHLLTDKNGRQVFFCYEFGLSPLPDEQYLLFRHEHTSRISS
jgi:hypothetical protein